MLQIALIVLAGTAVYSNTLQVRYVMDDLRSINFLGPQDIPEILRQGGSRRVTDATFALNYHLHGLQVAGYHLVNLAIHLVAAITLYLLAGSALAALRTSYSFSTEDTKDTVFVDRFVPLAVALLFALHPIQTQAVTYIIQRYTSLATCLYLLSALLFVRARLACAQSGTRLYPFFLGCGSLAAGILSLGSKQIAVTLPLMLIFLELFLFRGRLLNRRFYIVCGALAILVSTAVLITWHDRPLQELLLSLHRATAEDRFTPRWTYFLTQTRIVVTYLRLLCLPLDQSLFHNYRTYSTLFSLPVMASLVLHTSLIISAAVLYRLSGRRLLSGAQLPGTLQRLTGLGIVWFYISMSVESSFFPITDRIFEHRIYLPSVGFFLTIASATALMVLGRKGGFKAAWSLLAMACLVLGGLTIARNQVWGDTLLLWQDTVRKAPGNGLAVANLAGEYMERNQPDKALPLFVRALELNQVFLTMTKVHLGMTLQRLNVDGTRFTTGEEILSSSEQVGRAALSRTDQNRLQCIMYNNLGLAYEYLGEPRKAGEPYQAALLINPDYDLAWYNLGLLSIRLGDREQAAKALQQLKRLNLTLAGSLAKAMPQ